MAGKSWLRQGIGVLGALIMSLGWYPGWGPALVIGWLAWLYLLDGLSLPAAPGKGPGLGRRFLILWGVLLVWNGLSVWWIQGATVGGAIGATVAMAACMAVLLTLVTVGWRALGRAYGLFFLVACWLWFEWFFHNSEISWPWLTLGNAWAEQSALVQWYEYTGVLGGSLWTLLLAILLYQVLRVKHCQRKSFRLARYVGLGLAIVCPLIWSAWLWRCAKNLPCTQGEEVIIVQPNVDPYTEKYSGLSWQEQLNRLLSMAEDAITPATRLVVAPETALTQMVWLNTIQENEQILQIRQFLQRHPQVHFIVGASTYYRLPENQAPDAISRRLQGNPDFWYNAYNTALSIDTGGVENLYHKSKLVVGVEMLPYPARLAFLSKLSIDLGGDVGSLGTQPTRRVFSFGQHGKAAPIICYESLFGDFCRGYLAQGATLLAVITNDGWWGDTPGYRQHFSYSKLRAIEARRPLAQAANTGISAFVDHLGRTQQKLNWGEQGTLRTTIESPTVSTFYTLHGDYLGRIAKALLLLNLLVLMANWAKKRFPRARI